MPLWLIALLVRAGFQLDQVSNFNPGPLEVFGGILGILILLGAIGVVVVETIATRPPKNRNE